MSPGRMLFSALTAIATKTIGAADAVLGSIHPAWPGRLRGLCIETLFSRIEDVHHRGIDLKLYVPTALATYRATSFSDKEPETLAWIDGFSDNDVFWDIGANVGIYTIYAGLRHPSVKIYAFEPSIMNVELLARNVFLNGLARRTCLIAVPLFERSGEDIFKLQNLDRGGALSAYSVDYNQSGHKLRSVLEYGVLGMTADSLVETFNLPVPNHIKIDVDGVEHLILKGASSLLVDSAVKSILIEVNDDFAEQRQGVTDILSSAGFVLVRKARGNIVDTEVSHPIFNNIWIRK
jgi:FkbM family methyltransferase